MSTLTFIAPIDKGRTSQWQDFAHALDDTRASEFADMNRRFGLTRHAAWLQESSAGDSVIVLVEGPGADGFMGKLAASEQPFDMWMREQVESIHPIVFDAEPPAMAARGIDWSE